MTQVEKTYADGMAGVFEGSGMKKESAHKAAGVIVEMQKKANLFNFSDSYDPHEGGFSWSSVVIPLLAAAAAGYVGYQARDNGHSNLSAFDNIKNYFGDIGNKYIRRSRPRPLYDIRRYIDN